MRTVFDFGGRGRGLGRTKRPPGAPLERSVAMMEGWNATKIFRSFSNDAHYDRHIDACGVVSRLLVLPTRGGGPGP